MPLRESERKQGAKNDAHAPEARKGTTGSMWMRVDGDEKTPDGRPRGRIEPIQMRDRTAARLPDLSARSGNGQIGNEAWQ